MKTSKLHQFVLPVLLTASFVISWLIRNEIIHYAGLPKAKLWLEIADDILLTGLWLSTAFLFSRFLTVIVLDTWMSRRIEGRVPTFLHNMVAVIVLGVAVTGIMAFVYDQSVAGIWATSGVIGIVLGFALRSMIADIFTGLAINIEQTYKIGEWIVLEGGLEGCVEEINWRTTSIRTPQNNIVRVPNSNIGVKPIVNYAYPDNKSRFEVLISLDFSIETERALRVLQSAAKSVSSQHGFYENPEPKVLVKNINEIGVEYEIHYWINSWKGVSPPVARSRVLASVLEQLRHAGISIAYPKQDIYHEKMPTRHLDSATGDDCIPLLRKVELFKPLGESELAVLGTSIKRIEFTKGEVVIRTGDEGDSMFVVLEGLLEVFVDVFGDGDELRVGLVKPGQFLGEKSLLTGASRSATAKAATNAILYEITRDDLLPVLHQKGEVLETISLIIAERELRNSSIFEKASKELRASETSSLSKQILVKMKDLFSDF
ncbi:mechanosensitive ion channel family protein [Microscilla marina]|uniref:Transporter, small conductance mechanosensitive ion channel (MscS) family n=1 Tax=Microscilla marina ATCC 23134 TaxID=313606 RepID=A1ZG79_MICM2|nr:mechanosensitive ion channel family protein [Microscilla marina]EAY30496.1 transporter, small conductance mechanosensitive ion channel (MscS) family [Microscilla marina ATCC 23134]